MDSPQSVAESTEFVVVKKCRSSPLQSGSKGAVEFWKSWNSENVKNFHDQIKGLSKIDEGDSNQSQIPIQTFDPSYWGTKNNRRPNQIIFVRVFLVL